MQKGEYSRRLRKHHQRRRPQIRLKWAHADQPSPFRGPVVPSFDLAAIRTIYSPLAESHASTHSSFATEEQRREGHYSGEERVELVVYGLPSRRVNLARKTTSEFQ
jgi:hypothetical protein